MKLSRRNRARLDAQTAKGPAESKYGAKLRKWRGATVQASAQQVQDKESEQ
jgi:hypothetical protein